MTSLLFKCIPCARSGKVPISENIQASLKKAQKAAPSQPVESQKYSRSIQQTPTPLRARGYDTFEMDTAGTGNDGTTKDN
ncbi:unnamed protein product [Rotaria magnacalcarata]|uniref:Uncharacterized protein n=1 Tax=Rotaria magnacalcarata TaxID=392030 RepID=A0A821C1N6_9BILA|nr:unnamed protein product [Rotaria magnacalcarata]CAF5051705.1 unnamed protein product [Rotaria magnacalcarata]CAF5159187.1 unnamed protein product [Rotaria magnacalcarata]